MGYGAAKRLASGGAAMVIAAWEGAEEAAEQVRQETGNPNVLGVTVDVSRSEQVQAMVRQTVEAFAGVDILVNSAGIQRYGTVVDTEEDVWDDVLNINLKGIYLASKYAIPEMRKRGGGAIVHISSVQAYMAQKGVAAYSASKGAINALTRAMAVDHAAEGIRVNCVCPASIDTPMLRHSAEQFKGEKTQEDILKSWGTMHPLGRIGTIPEVAELIAFLCSERASFITGGDYKIDGGMLSALGVVLPE
ncbi:SDR family oxidoreductase [Paenibacillus cremeus]|uniref:SDR family oxidoreductase n=2 Tax=Paenibacillus cremeus TaxID=2163881 RepID=A0A559K022_9BACL|nr:SDR family oxidoreductase [Paenibacillus cremeus]